MIKLQLGNFAPKISWSSTEYKVALPSFQQFVDLKIFILSGI